MVLFKRVSVQTPGSIATMLLLMHFAVHASLPRQPRSLQHIISSTCDWKQFGDVLYGEEKGFKMGTSVAFSKDGSTVAVGSPGSLLTAEPSPGHVLIYDVNTEKRFITLLGRPVEGEFSGDRAGGAVALSGDGRTVAIGSSRNDDNAYNAGQTRTYRFDSAVDDWVQLGQDIEGKAEEEYSGSSVALNSDGSILAVGAPGNYTMKGQVRVYQISINNVWLQLGSDLDGLEPYDQFGASIALSADGFVLATGAPLRDSNGLIDSGEVIIYRYSNSTWAQFGSRLGGKLSGDRFGIDVSMSEDGKTVAGGAWLNDDKGFSSGHSRIFALVGDDWEQLGNAIVGESENDEAGYSLSLSADGQTLAVGADWNDGRNGIDSGHVRIFLLQEDTWVQAGPDLDGEAPGDAFGVCVSMSGDGKSIVAGAHRSSKNGIDAGSARVFTLDLPCPERKEEQVKKIELTFTGLGEINDAKSSHFESVTKEWYEAYYADEEIVSSVGIRNLATTLRVNSQKVLNGTLINNTLTYDQNFTFVDEGASATALDLLMQPFDDFEKVVDYVELLARNSTVFGNIQVPLGPPRLESLGSENKEPPAMSEDVGISKGGIVGIAFAALMLGLVVAGLFIWRQKGSSSQLGDDFGNLPVGELIHISDSAPTSSLMADAATLQPIAVDVLETDDHLPESKDKSGLVEPGGKAASGVKGDVSLVFKDQARPHARRIQSSPRSSSLESLSNDATRSAIGNEDTSAVIRPTFKDQCG